MLNAQREQVGFIAIESDVTAEKEWAARILASEREKQMLLQEIHHRVKNNLQIVSSLLMLQADQFTDSQTQLALQDSVRRVRSMALIHEQLYGTDSFAAIEMAGYTRALASQLQSMLTSDARLRIEATPVHVPMNTAIPMGLILNELLTNAFKYGIPEASQERRKRRTHLDDIVVEVGPHEQGVRLAVLDGGAGLSHNPLMQRSASLGLRLVQNLARQIRGAITYDSDLGSRFVLICPLESGMQKSAPPAAG
jgi:two-component sensor histidine kinase